MWVAGNEVVGGRVEVGEVAAAAAGDGDFFPDPFRVLEHNYFTSAFPSFYSAEEARCSSPDYNDIFLAHA